MGEVPVEPMVNGCWMESERSCRRSGSSLVKSANKGNGQIEKTATHKAERVPAATLHSIFQKLQPCPILSWSPHLEQSPTEYILSVDFRTTSLLKV